MANVKAYALNEVHIIDPDAKKVEGQPTKTKAIPANRVFDTDKDTFESLESLRAVRIATDEEVDIEDARAKREGETARPALLKSSSVDVDTPPVDAEVKKEAAPTKKTPAKAEL